MPRLVLFAACREVLISARDDSMTLVGLLARLQVPCDTAGTIPTVADVSWEHVAVWEAEPGEDGVGFEERVEVIGPDRAPSAEVRQQFVFSEPTVRVLGSVRGFPSDKPGRWVLRLSVRRADESDAWERRADYPVEVVYISADEPATSPELPDAGPDAGYPSDRLP